MPLTRIKLTAFADGGITTAKLADNSITIDKLNNNLALGGNDTGGTPFTITLPQGVGGTDWSTYAPITRSSSGATGDGYEVVKSTGYYIDTSAGTVTIKLPASANRGDYVSLVDYKGTNSLTATDSSGFYQNRIQINPNGHKINGVQQFTDIGSPKGGAQLVYVDADTGWVVTDAANEDTAKALVASTPRININGILNGNGQAYFQDTNDPAAGRQITISGSGFLAGATITMIDNANPPNSYPSGSSITPDSIADNQIVFTVPASVITAAKASGGSFDDRFDVKVTNSNGSFVLVADALQYAPRPNFELSADTLLGTVTDSQNNISGTTYATYDTLTFGAANNNSIVATSLDADDTITYSITNNGGLTNLAINSASGALTGTPASFPAQNTLTEYTIEITATATTRTLEDSTQPTVSFARNFKILLEGPISSPNIPLNNITPVHFSQSGVTITATGTNIVANSTVELRTAGTGTGSNVWYTAANPQVNSGGTQITFETTADMVTQGQIGGRDKFDLRINSPNTRTDPATVPSPLAPIGGYGGSAEFADIIDYFGAAPTITAGSNLGTLTAGTVDYTSLGASLTITTLDPDDTVQSVAVSNNSNLPGLGVSVSGKTVTLTGTNTVTTAGTYSFQIDVTTQSDFGGSSRTATTNQTYQITIASASPGPGYTSNIQNSLHFDGSSYLEKTNLGSVLAANGYTLSLWAKIIPHSGGGYFFSVSSNHGLAHQPDAANAGLIQYWNGSTQFDTPNKLRDYSSWYHIVFRAINASQAQLYINGESIVTANSISVGDFGGSSITNRIGAWYNNATSYSFTGYMANIHFIDGHALSPDYFAQTDTETGSWIPKEYDGTSSAGGTAVTGTTDNKYGTNGFHLDFRPSSLVYSGSTLTTVNDVSGITNPNNWSAN